MGHGGRRRGAGRKANTANKFVVARAERLERDGRTPPPETMLIVAERQLVMVERYQPQIRNDKGDLIDNPKFDEKLYGFWLREWRDTLVEAAPYYAPKLHAKAAEVHHTNQISISQKLETSMTPQDAMKAYIEMIDAKPL